MALVAGYLTKFSGLCLVRATRLAVEKKYLLLFAMLACGLWAWIPMILHQGWAEGYNYLNAYGYIFAWHFMLGGFLFGVGAGINGGCALGTLSKMLSGYTPMFVTIIFSFIGYSLVQQFDSPIPYFTEPAVWHREILIAASALTVMMTFFVAKDQRPVWIGTMIFGISSQIVISIDRGWLPTSMTNSVIASISKGEIVSTGAAIVFFTCFCLGIAIYNLRRDGFVWVWPSDVGALVRHSVGGILMGMGIFFGIGGNDIHTLLSAPAFSTGGISALVCIIAGILVVNRCKKWFA